MVTTALRVACFCMGLVALSGCRKKAEPTDAAEIGKPAKKAGRRATYVDAYAQLCGDGGAKDAFDGAARYKKGKKPSRVAIFRKYTDDKASRFKAYRPPELSAFTTEAPDQVELVMCVESTRNGTPVYCRFYGGELQIYDMTHHVRVLEAATGEELVNETVALDRKTFQCPGSYTFAKGVSTVFDGAKISNSLLSLLLPLQPKDSEVPTPTTGDLDAVCSGSPVPGAAAYDPSKDHKRKVHALYFPTEQQTFTYKDTPSGFPESRVIGKAEDYELVACTTGIPQKKKSECAFIGGKVLELHDGEIEVRVIEAKTAKLVETKRFKASSSSCPSTYKFWGQRDRVLTKIEPAAVKYFAELQGS